MIMKKLIEFQKMMSEVEERENIFVFKMYANERRLFTNDHKSDICFYAIAQENNVERYRAYYYYTSTMEKPMYSVHHSLMDAYEETRKRMFRMML